MTHTEKIIARIIIIALVAAFIFISWGCKSTAVTTITWEPVKRKEVAPYIERVMGQLSKNARVTEIGPTTEGKRKYVLMVDDTAQELKKYLIQK